MIRKFNRQSTFQAFLKSNIREHVQFETAIMSRRVSEQSFLLDGYCKVCDKPTTFLVDRLYGAQESVEA
ncbi:MAG: hypothetical protein ABFS56_34440, partial [Pseudomonadota bacterium]